MAKKSSANASPDPLSADDLERLIEHLDTLYEVGEPTLHPDSGIEVSDGEYDGLRRRLRELRPDSRLLGSVTASQVNAPTGKVVHDPPMTSIEKASHERIDVQEQQLFKWMKSSLDAGPEDHKTGKTLVAEDRTHKNEPVQYPSDYFYCAYKLDGVAIGLYYEQGKLVAAGLRPRDGINGEDVTAQARFVTGIPGQLKSPVTCSIRGELICKLPDFAKVQSTLASDGEKLRANPRNHAAGGIRQFRNPENTKRMRLSFIAYTIEHLASPPYTTETERATWCEKELGIPYIATRPFRFEHLSEMELAVSELDYEVDGVVIGVNNLEDLEQLGRHGDPRTGNPKGKIAWKFREEEATPVIKNIEWQTGRTGKIVAVAIFDPVRLAGTNVSRATLHNAGFMKRNRIAIGSQIAVRKAGKIIPKVTGVIAGQADPDFPAACPACGAKTTLVDGNTDEMLQLMCPSDSCSAQNISSLLHYLSSIGVLGLGESRVTQLVDADVITSAADFYRMDVESAMSAGLTRRQALLAVAAIQMIPSPEKQSDEQLIQSIADAMPVKKTVPLWQLFAAFGIASAGKAAGKALQNHFGSLDAIRAADMETLESVDDVGEITALAIREYLENNADAIDDLLQFVAPESVESDGVLTGMTFCFSGGFTEGKRHWEQLVEAAGGKCSGSVSKKTNYLVAGSGSGSKSKKAEQLEIPIISVDQLKAMLD